jgi:predicted NAD-dependent protein-ADP-ribosyltransferase YbiA (DUF1768 family)
MFKNCVFFCYTFLKSVYMVKSLLLSSAIDYLENRHLLPEDKNSEASLYEITLFEKDETIALGQPVYTYIENNIIYYPIYLVKNNKVTLQIGVYEIFADGLVNILDSDGDIDLDLIGQPLLYSFVEKELGQVESGEEEEDVGEEDVGEEEDESVVVVAPLPEQTASDAAVEKDLYKADIKNHWIQAYMENNNYRMVENEGRGDCLFAVIRDGLATTGVQKSVAEMRTILADNVTEEVFQGYKTIYQDAADTDVQLVKEMKTLVARHKVLKTKIDVLKDRNAKQVIIAQADEINKRHKTAKEERAYTKSVVEGELKMMKKVHNLTQFRALIKTCEFWGDTWAISTLERVLNIKIILFSEESFKEGDLDNVLTCGQLNDSVLEEKGIFQPDYYILTLYQGYHYQLITYKDKGALTFKELPYDVKMKVVDKCLERMAGPYYIIPEFREFIKKLNNPATVHYTDTASLIEKDAMEDIQTELFNKFTVFQFYSKSITKLPGKGAGEIISANEMNEYTDLSRIPDWRKKLSNFWVEPFTLDGHNWSSVEHYYQGSKFKRNNPEFYLQFSLDSGSELSKNSAMAKGAGGKTGKFLKVQIRPKNMMVDEDFFGPGKRGEKEMEAAQYAKFSQHEELKYLLQSTKKAKLQHFSRGSPPIVFYDLMRVRQKLALTNNT